MFDFQNPASILMLIPVAFLGMITIISVTSIYFGYKAKKYKQNIGIKSSDNFVHPLHKFRSFDERIRKIEERINNLEILIEPEDEKT